MFAAHAHGGRRGTGRLGTTRRAGLRAALLFSLILALGLLAAGPTANAAASQWNPVGSYTIAFTCTAGCTGTYVHTMDITSYDSTTGNFSGVGHYNGDLTKTWNITGVLTGSGFTSISNDAVAV